MPRLSYVRMEAWPPLAWIARCTPGAGEVVVTHGPGVFVQADWFCEAVWDGAFSSGDLDRSDLVFGSGGRVRPEGLTFVSSATTIDRLHTIRHGGASFVSNSLVCLVAWLGLDFDPTWSGYRSHLESIVSGIRNYPDRLRCSGGEIVLVYHDNLRWNGSSIERLPKPDPPRTFRNYDDYRAFLSASLKAIAANMRDPARSQPMGALATASSGYDSSAVTVLAQEIGLRKVLTAARTRGGRDDSGLDLIEHLGLEPLVLERSPVPPGSFLQVPFLTGDGLGRELFLVEARAELPGHVLFTGYHGDYVWTREPSEPERSLMREGPSGLSLTEYRLWVGLIHCPVAFFGARELEQIRRIACSEEMSPWSVGGDYDRPIPRRIVEDTGFPREGFATRKNVTGVHLTFRPDLHIFLRSDPIAEEDLRGWLRRRQLQFLMRGRVPPLLREAVDTFVGLGLQRLWARLQRLIPALARSGFDPFRRFGHTHFSLYLFPWAVDRAARRYGERRR